MLTVAQTMKNISNFMVGKSSLQEIAPLAIILSGRYQTLIWRPGDTVQTLESPTLSGRVDRTVFSLVIVPLLKLSFVKLTLSDRFTVTLGLILLAHWTTKLVLLLAQDQNLLALGSHTWVFSCPDHVLKGSSNNLEDIPGSIIYHYNQQRPHLFSKNFA